MKIIFLDVDGVLNCLSSTSVCCGCFGVDKDKVKRLRKIVDATGAKIVLCSSWKNRWYRAEKDEQNELANYLDRKLRRENLYILDKTSDHGIDRGYGIQKWIEQYGGSSGYITDWVVLDDEIFLDYSEQGILSHLVKTDMRIGLTDEDAENAVKILKERS